jgi:hypothetical protein
MSILQHFIGSRLRHFIGWRLRHFIGWRVKNFIGCRLRGRRTAAQKPVIEIALCTPSGLNALQSFRFLNKRLGLPPFDALVEKLALS